MKYFSFLITTLLLFVGCSTLQVTTDYDDTFNFSKQKSFAVKHENKEGEDTLSNDRIIDSLEADLKLKGYKKVSQEEADLIFVFHVDVEKRSDIQTDYQMMGYGRYRYGGAMVATTSTYNYTEGTLIVDALNPKNEKIVWRAIGVAELKEQKTPQKRKEYIEGIIKKMMSSFPK
ncbi:hypothetical protein SMGD1_2517 [Sulfurimonas gotlandica GD1]|uniref:DUF4136 domain-containing protein n=1 Tax=Sulfurimonas gotlandica (strain DSM 19862 / JCM 16533 / GD1) TaxID=929558 RepID=B6BNG9_SULGG|nr:DUF4136 domain-containing protein [Sulfurimonas gotlandica]EDZ61332.1 conserved hypothetical protein [Sulfurimonas gotlandica GD1]EHP31039.1 hypothetical protein SMGD1_2517 [Sulfurimonas gotlandica GD1]